MVTIFVDYSLLLINNNFTSFYFILQYNNPIFLTKSLLHIYSYHSESWQSHLLVQTPLKVHWNENLLHTYHQTVLRRVLIMRILIIMLNTVNKAIKHTICLDCMRSYILTSMCRPEFFFPTIDSAPPMYSPIQLSQRISLSLKKYNSFLKFALL